MAQTLFLFFSILCFTLFVCYSLDSSTTQNNPKTQKNSVKYNYPSDYPVSGVLYEGKVITEKYEYPLLIGTQGKVKQLKDG
jgi:hypothetical protein